MMILSTKHAVTITGEFATGRVERDRCHLEHDERRLIYPESNMSQSPSFAQYSSESYNISTSTFFATASNFGHVAFTSSLTFSSECGTLAMTC